MGKGNGRRSSLRRVRTICAQPDTRYECFEGNRGEIAERQGRAHEGISKRIDATMNGNGNWKCTSLPDQWLAVFGLLWPAMSLKAVPLVIVVSLLLTFPAKCKVHLRDGSAQTFHVLPHWERSCESNTLTEWGVGRTEKGGGGGGGQNSSAGNVLGSLSCVMQCSGFDPPLSFWLKDFPSETTWVLTPFLKKILRMRVYTEV